MQDHDTKLKIGFTDRPNLKGKDELRFDHITYLDTKEANDFISQSQKGFPFEASISGNPTRIERLLEGKSDTVNGLKVKGPVTIWRDTDFRESSVVVFGYDSKTESKAEDLLLI